MYKHTLRTKQHINKTTPSLPKTISRWQVADVMKINVDSTIFKEMLATLDTREDHCDMEKPQEAFLAKKGEVKYWLHDSEAFTKLKEYEGNSTNTGKSKSGVLKSKSKKSDQMQAIQSAFPLHDTLINVTQDASTLVGNYSFAYENFLCLNLNVCSSSCGHFFKDCKMVLAPFPKVLALPSLEAWKSGNLTQVFEKASKDLQNVKAGIERLVSHEPANITQDLVDEAKQILLCCKQHKEGLQKTLHKAKVLLE